MIKVKEQFSHAAAQGGDVAKVKSILSTSSDSKALVNSADDDTWTSAHYASWYGHLSVVEVLLQNGLNVNVINSNGSTPLHYATGIFIIL